jgi:hypothetical protein
LHSSHGQASSECVSQIHPQPLQIGQIISSPHPLVVYPKLPTAAGRFLFRGAAPGDHNITLHFEHAMNSVAQSGLPRRLIETQTKSPWPHAGQKNMLLVAIL